MLLNRAGPQIRLAFTPFSPYIGTRRRLLGSKGCCFPRKRKLNYFPRGGYTLSIIRNKSITQTLGRETIRDTALHQAWCKLVQPEPTTLDQDQALSPCPAVSAYISSSLSPYMQFYSWFVSVCLLFASCFCTI